jgi:protein SCO1/2
MTVSPRKLITPLAVGALALGALGLGVWTAAQRQGAVPQLQSGTALHTPRPIAPFALTDQDGQPYGNERLQGRWSLLFVGFTHCPDVCPTTLSLMKSVEQRLQSEGRALSPVFVSVDPQRDTPPRLQQYVRYFSPTLVGITGSSAELDKLCASLGLAYVKIPGAGEADYTMDHSAALVLVNPEGRIAAYFQAPHKLDTLAADLARIVPPA